MADDDILNDNDELVDDPFQENDNIANTSQQQNVQSDNLIKENKKRIKTPEQIAKEKIEQQRKQRQEQIKNSRIDKMKVFGKYPLRHLYMVSFGYMYPGNIYLMRYGNFKHDPYPLFFYMGYNPKYRTIEGVNLHYLPFQERKRTVDILRRMGYLRKIFRFTHPITKERMYYMRATRYGQLIYYRFKSVLPRNTIFYRRYKVIYSKPIYLVPYNHIDYILYIISPMRKFNAKELKNIKRGLSIIKRIKR